MNNKEFIEKMNKIEYIDENSILYEKFHSLSEEARKITMELNNKYHTQDEIRELFSQLTDKKIDNSFNEEQKRLFPDTEQRKDYFRALDNLKNAYNSLTRQNAEEKIEKQVRLMQSKRR